MASQSAPPASGKGLKAVAWDIDGTLIDSEGLHQQALIACSIELGADLSDISEDEFRGVHLSEIWTRLAPRCPATVVRAGWVKAIQDYYIVRAPGLHAIEGARETVEALGRLGVLQGCVSNSGRRIVDANLATLRLDRHFAFTLSYDDFEIGKPDPVPYLLAAARFGLPPAAVAAVEDSATGALSARRAGLFVAVCGPDSQSGVDCDLRLGRLSELLPMFV